uniref:Uncharacterized protein n=1 Tax=Acrobeloides nanus TaxID=290746 RepID=A0A914DEZ7_9BILA
MDYPTTPRSWKTMVGIKSYTHNKEELKMSKFFRGPGESSESTETSLDPKSSPNKSDNVLFRCFTKSDFGSRRFEELKESMDAINEENELKRPLVLMADHIVRIDNNMVRIVNKMESGFNQIHEHIEEINNQLSHILGENKKDNIAAMVEKQAKKWMEKKYRRSFEQSFMLKCDDGEIEEIDLYSAPYKKDDNHIMAECTALISAAKVLKCVRKRNELAKKLQVNRNEIIVYIFALRIDQTKENQIIDEAKKHGVRLQISVKQST